MTEISRRLLLAGAATTLSIGRQTSAQTASPWPERAVRLISLAAAGGGTDAVARALAESLSKRWGQPVIVDNRPGGEGIVSIEAFLAAGDVNHKLLFNPAGTWSTLHLMHERLSFDPRNDLLPISLVVRDFIAVAASPELAASNLRDVVELARAQPGKLTWSSAPSVPYLAFNGFLKGNGLDLLYVPYRNPLASIPDLADGRVDLTILPLAPMIGPAHAAKLKLMMVANEERAPLAPNLPTAREAGFPSLAINAAHCLFGSKEMPQPLRERIAADVRIILEESSLKQRLMAMGYMPRGAPPAEVADFLARERAHWTTVAHTHGARPRQ